MTDNKQLYKCAICCSEYETIQDRANCETACVKKVLEAEKKAAAAKIEAEKDERFAEASSALDNALALVNKCVEDYGSFKYNGKLDILEKLNMDFFPSKLWHHFWY